MRIHRLDVLGLRCPAPMLMTARVVREVAPGDRVLVIGDDPEMIDDLTRWCAESGHRLLEQAHEGGELRCLIEKAAAAGEGSERGAS